MSDVKKANSILGNNMDAEDKQTVGMPPRVRIMLEENDNIPPTGLFIGHNGTSYMLRPGREVDVPPHILEVLDNAVMATGIVDPDTRKVVGYRQRLRYPYRMIRSAA